MTEKSGIGNSFAAVIKALINVLIDLFRKAPLLVIVLILLVFLGVYSISTYTETVKLVMSISIGLFSIGIYLRNNNFSETILTLFLGLLTVFSIDWNRPNTLIFSGVLLSFIIIYFLISSIRIASQLESILMQASTFISVKNHKQTYQNLNSIVKTQTKYKQLSIIEKANAAKYLVFAQFPLDSIVKAIEIVETIKIIYDISLDHALEFFQSVNQVINKSHNRNINIGDIEMIHEKLNKLPYTPSEFLDMFRETKTVVISGKLSIDTYFIKLAALIETGYSKKKIIDTLNE